MGEGWGQKPGVRRQTRHPRQGHGSFGGSRDGGHHGCLALSWALVVSIDCLQGA